MSRYKLTIEYDGTGLAGWQYQDNGLSVQEILESAAKKLSGIKTKIIGAARTDAGVHAIGQVAHVDFDKNWDPNRIRDGMNFWLLKDGASVSILTVDLVTDNFHARFSAIERRYLYRIVDRQSFPALKHQFVFWTRHKMNIENMHNSAQLLIGSHDFSTFRASECQAKSPIKTLDRLDVIRVNDEIHIIACARSFLHHQVRNIVGTLCLVGWGKWTNADVLQALMARDRSKGGATITSKGLYLTSVVYHQS
ncbi:MAG: tRNA pseudouridine(38-40) synthase TruA [Rhodospirillaceae bacterium]|jgi:tRNA pseudouridine38-40 synthase|nr:tRNA pseudouridine(38-40) synthase TruA [Rhodospirillaceae bacterium]